LVTVCCQQPCQAGRGKFDVFQIAIGWTGLAGNVVACHIINYNSLLSHNRCFPYFCGSSQFSGVPVTQTTVVWVVIHQFNGSGPLDFLWVLCSCYRAKVILCLPTHTLLLEKFSTVLGIFVAALLSTITVMPEKKILSKSLINTAQISPDQKKAKHSSPYHSPVSVLFFFDAGKISSHTLTLQLMTREYLLGKT